MLCPGALSTKSKKADLSSVFSSSQNTNARALALGGALKCEPKILITTFSLVKKTHWYHLLNKQYPISKRARLSRKFRKLYFFILFAWTKNTPSLIKKLFFIVNFLKLLYDLKSVLVAYATTNRDLKTRKLKHELTPLCGYPGIPGDFAMSKCFKH